MKALESRQKLIVVLVLGLAIRIAFSWMPGTEDTYFFRMWGAQALRSGWVSTYSLSDQDVLTLVLVRLKHIPVHVRASNPTDLGPIGGLPDYPPLSILLLEIPVSMCKLLQGGNLRAGPLLNTFMNLPPVLFSLGMALVVWIFIKNELGVTPTAAIAAFWLNPGMILTSPILGYQDPIFSFLCLLSLLCIYRHRYTCGMLLLALACLTKPQGVFVVPIAAMAIFCDGRWRALWRYGLQFLLFGLLPLLPFVLAGRTLGILVGVSQQVMYPALSAQQLNAWWLVGGLLRSIHGQAPGFFTSEIAMLSKEDFTRWAGFHPLWIALPLFAAFTAANLYYLSSQLRAGNRWALFWAAGLEVFGYNMLMVYTHEHHLYAFLVYALPLLALGKVRINRLYWGLSILYGLNVFLFDGFGKDYKGAADWLRTVPGFDLTIPLALANIAIFVSIICARHWFFEGTGLPDNRSSPGENTVLT